MSSCPELELELEVELELGVEFELERWAFQLVCTRSSDCWLLYTARQISGYVLGGFFMSACGSLSCESWVSVDTWEMVVCVINCVCKLDTDHISFIEFYYYNYISILLWDLC